MSQATPNQEPAARDSGTASAIRRWLRRFVMRLSRPYRTWKQSRCEHVIGPDRGLLIGSNKVDRWCSKCGKRIQIPLAEENYDA